jgi:hypothetical protein
MADEQTPNTDTSTTTTAPATQSPAPTTPAFTQADIDAAAQRAANAAWAEARRTFEGKQKQTSGGQPQPPKNEQPASTPQPAAVDVRAEIARIRSFERAAGSYGLSADAIATLEEDFNAANPPDPTAWVQKRANAFGWKAAGAATQPPASTPVVPSPPAVPGTPPVTSRATPPPAGAPTDDTPIMSMSEGDRRALAAKIGDKAFAERHLKELVKGNTRIRPRTQ